MEYDVEQSKDTGFAAQLAQGSVSQMFPATKPTGGASSSSSAAPAKSDKPAKTIKKKSKEGGMLGMAGKKPAGRPPKGKVWDKDIGYVADAAETAKLNAALPSAPAAAATLSTAGLSPTETGAAAAAVAKGLAKTAEQVNT